MSTHPHLMQRSRTNTSSHIFMARTRDRVTYKTGVNILFRCILCYSAYLIHTADINILFLMLIYSSKVDNITLSYTIFPCVSLNIRCFKKCFQYIIDFSEICTLCQVKISSYIEQHLKTLEVPVELLVMYMLYWNDIKKS